MQRNRINRRSLVLATAGVISLMGLSQSASAATYTWAAGAGNWTGDNWSGTPWVDGSTSVAKLTNNSGGTITISGTVNPGGGIIDAATSGTYTLSGGTVTLGASTGITANTGGTLAVATYLKDAGTGQATWKGNVNLLADGTIDVSQINYQGGTLTQSGGYLKATAGLANLTIGYFAPASGTSYVLNGGSFNATSLGLSGYAAANSNTTFTVNGGTANVNTIGIGSGTTATSARVTINLSSGVLSVNSISKNNTITPTTPYTLNLSGGTLRPNNNNGTFGSATATSNIAITLTGSSGTISSTDAGGTNRTVDVYSVIGEDAAGRGLTFAGGGTTNLRANNTYSGTTTVTGGKLSLLSTGALQNSTLDVGGAGTVSFDVAGTNTYTLGGLKGVGSINAGANTLNLKSLAPGNSPGTINVTGAVTLASDASSSFEIASGGVSDHLTATSIALGGTLNLSQYGSFSFAAGQSWDLFDGTLTSSFTTINTPTLDSSLKWDTSHLTAGGDGVLSIASASIKATIGLSGSASNTNVATGGTVNITGTGGKYVSEIDELTSDVAKGSAALSQSVSAPTYAMLWLTNGDAAKYAALASDLSGSGITAMTDGSSDAQWNLLASHYSGFNMLIKFDGSGTALNWDFGTGNSYAGVVVDKVAVVPEPASLGAIAIGAMGLLSRRRRKTA